MFVEHVDYTNHAAVHRRMLPEIVSVLNSFITFTRASVATRVNEAGLIETVPTNTARQDYDPITLQKKGLLIEEARTNILLRSTAFTNATWQKKPGHTHRLDGCPTFLRRRHGISNDGFRDFRRDIPQTKLPDSTSTYYNDIDVLMYFQTK
jgi:hypothetical protein